MDYCSEGLFSHNVIKIFPGDFPTIGSSPLKHFLKFSNIHSLSKFLCDSFNIIGIDGSRSIIIKKVENFIDAILDK